MSYSIICSTKILTLGIAPVLFLSVGVPCEFAMVPDMYILQSPMRKRSTLPPEGTNVQICITLKKKFKKDSNLFWHCITMLK